MSKRLVNSGLWPVRVVSRIADRVGGIVAEPEAPREMAARLSLFGFVPGPIRMRVVARSPLVRRVRAVTTFCGAAFFTPFAFLVPPHLESFLVAAGFAAYLVHREWNAEYLVLEGEGTCPACAASIILERDSTLRLPSGLVCDACAQQLTIEAGAASGARARPSKRAAPPVELVADDVAIAAFWRRNQAASHSAWSPGSSSWRD